MSFDATLNRRGTIERQTVTKSGGEWGETFASVATAVPFRAWPANARDLELAGIKALGVTHKATFQIGANVLFGDRITDAGDGQVYEVQSVNPVGSRHHLEVLLLEREYEAVT